MTHVLCVFRESIGIKLWSCGSHLFTSVLLFLAIVCTPTEVAHSNMETQESITGIFGDSVPVICDPGYTGSATAYCQSTGVFSTVGCFGMC